MRIPFRRIEVGCAILALILASGCETSRPVHHPKTSKTLDLSQGSPSAPLEVEIITELDIVLPGPNSGSGLVWEIGSNDVTVLDQMGPLKVRPPSGVSEISPTTLASFYALRSGKSVLRFYLVNPEEREATPILSRQVTVRVTD